MGQVDLPEIQPRGSKSADEYLRYLADMVAIIRDEIDNIFGGRISTKNIRELTADKIKTGTLLAALVTIKGALNSGGYITIDSNGMTVNNGTKNVMRIDLDGNITVEDGVITGGTVRSGPNNTARIELSGGKFTGYTASNQKTGLYFDINSVPGTGLADLRVYHNDVELLAIIDNVTNCAIRPGSGSSNMILGTTGKTVNAHGSWSFSSGYSGSFSVVTGVDFTSQTVTTKTVTVSGGIVTSVS